MAWKWRHINDTMPAGMVKKPELKVFEPLSFSGFLAVFMT